MEGSTRWRTNVLRALCGLAVNDVVMLKVVVLAPMSRRRHRRNGQDFEGRGFRFACSRK